VPLPAGDFDKAMQGGLIQGADQSVVITAAFGWMNNIKSFTVSRHVYQPAALVCNQAWFAKLPADQQKAVDAVMPEIEMNVRQKLQNSEREFLDIFRSKGIVVNELSAAARAEFIEKTAPVRKKFGKTIPPEVMKIVEKAKSVN
jgi:TRAP-type C4-dicarboxylate transport system substrate-binding protein